VNGIAQQGDGIVDGIVGPVVDTVQLRITLVTSDKYELKQL